MSKDTFTLRISKEENAEIKALAKSLGLSQNAFITLSVKLFKQSYGELIAQNQAEFLRFLSQM